MLLCNVFGMALLQGFSCSAAETGIVLRILDSVSLSLSHGIGSPMTRNERTLDSGCTAHSLG
jgi:hypothetical protein